MRKNKVGLKNIIIIFGILIVAFIGGYIYLNNRNTKPIQTPASEKFKALQSYLTSSGYTCQNLNSPGTSCEKTTDVNKFSFFRYDDGIHYITESLNYKVNILSRKDSKDISLQTYDSAFDGYQNKKYICKSENGTILASNIKCKTDYNEELDNEVYLTVIKNALSEVRLIIDKSGFSVNKLVTDYTWEK